MERAKPQFGLVPMAHVADVERSIAFYQRLGFEEHNRHTPEGFTRPTWAWLTCGRSHIMVTLASEPVVPSQQAVLFYMYCEDVSAYHAELEQSGIDVSPVKNPFYSPRGEFRVTDPDGYCLIVSHS